VVDAAAVTLQMQQALRTDAVVNETVAMEIVLLLDYAAAHHDEFQSPIVAVAYICLHNMACTLG